MSRSVVYTLHLWPPLGHAKHYTGSSRKLPERLTDHALGRGARLTQVQCCATLKMSMAASLSMSV